MNIKNMTIEEVLGKINIQGNLTDLLSKDMGTVKSALTTLASAAHLAKRKECLYALVGYYVLEVKSIDDIEMFYHATKHACSPELLYLILKDLAGMHHASKRRIFMNDLSRNMRVNLKDATPDQLDQIKDILNNASWGEKQKNNFLNYFSNKTEPDTYEDY